MYNKLFTKILDSSVWLESMPTRIVWLTFLAVMDEHGFCQFAAVANVAHRARVSLPEAKEAIRTLESPDADSSNPNNEGRRLERVPGGWIVINANEHRNLITRALIQEQTRERVKRFRERLKQDGNAPVTQSNAKPTNSNAPVTTSVALALSESKQDQEHLGNSKGVNKSTHVGNTLQRGNGKPNARSKRPIFTGQRFVVFDWMLEDLMRALGTHTDAFDLHSWFFDLDAAAVKNGQVMPKTDQWPWLQAQLTAEAQRRGLPIAVAVTHNPKTAGNIAALQAWATGK